MSGKNEQRLLLDGPAGAIETALYAPEEEPRGIALVAHPHPLFGGTLTNKVVQTLARAFVELGYLSVCPNFRGVGKTEGVHDEGRGETDDLIAVVHAVRQRYGNLPLLLAGFSFGSFVQSRVRERLEAERLVLIAPAVTRFQVGSVPANTFVLHGEKDEVVPLQAVFDWARPQNLPILVLPGADHFFHGRLVELRQIVLDACRFS